MIGTIPTEVSAGGPTRRQVTVLFCDMVGSTELAGELDPEEYQEILDRYRQCVSSVVVDHGGYLHHTLGDGLMASWGHPRAREDDAFRAVMAGLAAVGDVAVMNADSPPAGRLVRVRIAIHTGLVLVTDVDLGGLHEQNTVVGETPNVAARLQSIGAPGTVVVSESTYDLVRERFDCVDLGSRALAGVVREIRVYTVRGPIVPPPVESFTEAVVGRAIERALLLDAWRRALAGASETIEVIGDAGMGKSRLVGDLCSRAQADGHPPIVVRCSPLWTDTAFGAMRQFVLGAAGTASVDPAEPLGVSLRTFFERIGLSEPGTIAALLSLAGVPDDQPDTASPDERRERTFLALAQLVESLSAGSVALVVFDDLHWADPSTAQLLRRLADQPREAGRLLVLVSRTGSDAVAESAQICLGPLDRAAVVELARLVVPGLSADWYRTLARRSDGVPLFVTELGRVVAEHGTDEAPPIPPRLNDLLIARLDQHPEQRTMLQALASMALPADRSLLGSVLENSPERIRADLAVLIEAGLVVAEGPDHDPNYRFTHVLLQDAAYATMLKKRRRAVHRSVVDELLAPERVGAVPSNVIAHHLEQAGEATASLTWWWRAALEASELAAHPETIRHLRHLLDLLPGDSSESPVDEVEALVLLGGSLIAIEGYTSPEVSRVVERARTLLATSPDSAAGSGTYYQLWAYHHVRGELHEAQHLSEMLSQRRHDAAPSVMLGHDLFEQGDLAGAIKHLERGRRLAAADRGQSLQELTGGVPHDVLSATCVVLGIVQWMTGDRETGRRTVQEGIERAASLDPPTGAFTRAYVLCYAAWFDLLTEDVPAAIAHTQGSIAEAAAHGYNSWLVASSIHAAGAAATLGDAVTSVPALQSLLSIWRSAGAEGFRPTFLRWLARGYAAGGDVEAAIATLDEGIQHVGRFGDRLHLPELLRERGLRRRSQGRVEDAVADFESAAAEGERQGAWSFVVRALTDLADTVPERDSTVGALNAALSQVHDPSPAADLLKAQASAVPNSPLRGHS